MNLLNEESKIRGSVLLARVITEKDEQAFDQLYLRYQPFVKSIIASHVKSADREDLLQDVFMKIWDNKGTYDPTQVAKAYIRGLVKNLISLHFRQQDRRIKAVSIESLDFPENLVADLKLVNTGQMSDADVEIIKKLINQLPPQAKQAIWLKYFDGLNIKEAALKAGGSPNAFYKRTKQAHNLLRKLWTDWGEDQKKTCHHNNLF